MIWSHMGIREEQEGAEGLHDWWRARLAPVHLTGGYNVQGGGVPATVATSWRHRCFCFAPQAPHRLPFMYPDGAHFDLLCLCPASAFQRSIHSTPAGVFLQTHAHAVLTHIIVSRCTIRPVQVLHFCALMIYLLYVYCPSECQRFTNIQCGNQQLLRPNTSKANI